MVSDTYCKTRLVRAFLFSIQAVKIKATFNYAGGVMTEKLTAKQLTFCEEYTKDLNATQAAIRAGYSEKSANKIASQLWSKLDIQQKIAELMQERSQRVKIDADWVLMAAKKIYDRCMQEEPILDRDGNPIKVVDGDGVIVAAYKFDSSGANKALDTIGKHVSVQAFNEKVTSEVTHKVDKSLADRLLGGSKR